MSDFDPDQALLNITSSFPPSKKGQMIDLARAIADDRLRARHLWDKDHGYYIVMPFDGSLIFRDIHGNDREWVAFAKILLGAAAVLLTIAALVCIVLVGPLYLSSSRSATIYNQLNHTHYTAWDFLLASRQINASTTTIKLQKGDDLK